MTYLESASFMQDFLAKDRIAHNALFKAFHKELFALAYSITDRTDEAADIVIKGFTALFQQTHRFSDPPSGVFNIRNFLLVTVKNAALNSIKMHARLAYHQKRFIELLDTDLDFEYTIGFAEYQEARLRSAVNMLPTQSKEVVRLVYDENLSHAEVAVALSISIGTVRKHLQRAKSQLQKTLMSAQSVSVCSAASIITSCFIHTFNS